MKTKDNNITTLKFSDVIGNFSVLNSVVFLPKLDAFCNLASLKEAEDKLGALSTVAFYNKSIITHGTIYKREYLFFYSNNGYFDSNRVFEDKLDNLSFFSHDGMRLIVFLGREIVELLKSKEDIIRFFKMQEMQENNPRIILILESETLNKNKSLLSYNIFKIFDKLEVIIYLGKDVREIEKKEGTMLLC